MTQRQIAALKYMIFIARPGVELTKRVLAFLIDQSEGLTKEVCLTLTEGCQGYSAEEINIAAHGMSAMRSCNSTTHLSEILDVMGSELDFDVHYGDFDPTREGDPFSNAGQFAGWDASLVRGQDAELVREGMPLRYTFWLARKFFSRGAVLVTTTREELEKINLKKPGLYPSIEPA